MSWDDILLKNGLKSLFPTEEYFSNDDTEAWIMIDYWIREGIIVRLEEYDLISNQERFWS